MFIMIVLDRMSMDAACKKFIPPEISKVLCYCVLLRICKYEERGNAKKNHLKCLGIVLIIVPLKSSIMTPLILARPK